jgi:hypothetical protein
MEKFNLVLNYIAAFLIASIIFGSLFLTYNYINIEDKPIQKIKIEYHGIKTDSINELNKIEIKQIDSILNRIESITNETQLKQTKQIEENENDNIFNKLYTAIIAIVIALAGFFGFKSVSDIKERAIKDAKEQATDIAKTEFEAIFTDEFRAKIQKETEETFMDFYKEQIESFETRISKLESEEDITAEPTESTNSTDEPENLFDNE